ncbi:60S ribosomal protein L28-like [Prionailurus viverrinus]|uniref:60S ribosomal protein L28-like n=1 Tax=Prionailurus viverrinus TaxID=61388 RepID=UPI001FF5A703|nr:60S ribosomal protein L28-like [Prionailurus viverrinus]
MFPQGIEVIRPATGGVWVLRGPRSRLVISKSAARFVVVVVVVVVCDGMWLLVPRPVPRGQVSGSMVVFGENGSLFCSPLETRHVTSEIERNKQTFSTDPNNPKARKSSNDNGLIHLYTVGMKSGADGKRVVVVTKRRSLQGKPTTPYLWTTTNKNARATLGSIGQRIHKNKDHPDPYVVAIRTASAIPRRQKPVTVKRKRPAPPRAPEHLPPTSKPYCGKSRLLQ